eukprot:2861247-Rhodomonas_salina.1
MEAAGAYKAAHIREHIRESDPWCTTGGRPDPSQPCHTLGIEELSGSTMLGQKRTSPQHTPGQYRTSRHSTKLGQYRASHRKREARRAIAELTQPAVEKYGSATPAETDPDTVAG